MHFDRKQSIIFLLKLSMLYLEKLFTSISFTSTELNEFPQYFTILIHFYLRPNFLKKLTKMYIKKLSKIAFLSRCKIKLSNCIWVVISSLKYTHNRLFTRMNMSAFFLRIVIGRRWPFYVVDQWCLSMQYSFFALIRILSFVPSFCHGHRQLRRRLYNIDASREGRDRLRLVDEKGIYFNERTENCINACSALLQKFSVLFLGW